MKQLSRYSKGDKNYGHSTKITRVKACNVCKHSQLIEIENDIIAHMTSKRIAEKYDVKDYSVRRHSSKHMTYKMAHDVMPIPVKPSKKQMEKLIKHPTISDPPEPTYVDTKYVVGRLQQLEAHALTVLEVASTNQNFKLVLRAIKEVRECLQSYADLAAKLRYQASLQVLQSEQWRIIQNAIMTALDDYPDAKLKVTIALEKVATEYKNTTPD